MEAVAERKSLRGAISSEGMNPKQRRRFRLWNGVIFVLMACGIGVCSLLLAFGHYSWGIFSGYFRHPLILLLNLLPVVLLALLFLFITGRIWIAFLVTSAIIILPTVGSYFKLLFRDDPFIFADVSAIATASGVAGKYNLAMDERLWAVLAFVVLGTVFLALTARARPSRALRIAGIVIIALSVWPLWTRVYSNPDIYNNKTQNYEYANRWSATQVNISRGFVYPFLYSIYTAQDIPPDGYDEDETKAILDEYEDTQTSDISAHSSGIPDDRKVNILAFQLEAFSDFTRLGIEGIDSSVYAAYHQIERESVSGTLITNVFGGGTINTEQAFLTGYYQLGDYRKNADSYVWYLRSQGYTTLGAHSCYAWFYNRRNVMSYLGFENYYFLENHFEELTGGGIGYDDVMLPEALRLYREAAEESDAVFSFNITYQGHGPYDDEASGGDDLWYPEQYYGEVSESSYNIMTNYLASVRDTGERMLDLLDELRGEDEPVVLVLYGDHKPWLGDDGGVYSELGVSLDLSTQEGFYNYYSTRYVIWANDAAKDLLGESFVGEGETLSANYLMNELFELLGWTGNSYMQLTDDVREALPVITSNGFYSGDGNEIITELDETQTEALDRLLFAQYYTRRHFGYAGLVE